MNDLYFDDVSEKIQNAYSNIFLLALKKRIDLKEIINCADVVINEYIDSFDDFIPDGIGGMLFFSCVAQMMDYSVFDIINVSQKEKERILETVIDNITITNISEYDLSDGNCYFVYNYYVDSKDREIDYELTFLRNDQSFSIFIRLFADNEYGFPSDYIYDSVLLWESNQGRIYQLINAIIEQLESIEDEKSDINVREDISDEFVIDYKDFFIHSRRSFCDHETIKVIATVPIYSDFKVDTISFEAEYCSECGTYYISEHTYRNIILPKGRLLCQVLSLEEYKEYKNQVNTFDELKPQSILNMLGYNVNSKENLSDHERQTILRYALESGLISKMYAITYLKGVIKRASGRNSFDTSISKWKRDLQWVYSFDKKGDIIYGVRRIIGNVDTIASYMPPPE